MVNLRLQLSDGHGFIRSVVALSWRVIDRGRPFSGWGDRSMNWTVMVQAKEIYPVKMGKCGWKMRMNEPCYPPGCLSMGILFLDQDTVFKDWFTVVLPTLKNHRMINEPSFLWVQPAAVSSYGQLWKKPATTQFCRLRKISNSTSSQRLWVL